MSRPQHDGVESVRSCGVEPETGRTGRTEWLRTQQVGRRAALLAVTTFAVAACSRRASPDEASQPAARAPARSMPSIPSSADLPVPPPYEVLSGEVERPCKVAAIRWLETALTWTPQSGGGGGAADRLRRAKQPDTVAADVRPLLTGDVASTLAVTYAQYGGLARDRTSASVMVTAEQTVRPRAGERPLSRGVTLDVRLVKAGRDWRVSQVLLPPASRRVEGVSDAARRTLASDRILLPATARADVDAGLVDDRVLTLLAELSDRWTLEVLVLRSGHPRNVFGTDRPSNHTLGRAVDIWAIDGIPVINQRKADWRGLMTAAAALGVNEIGGPKDLDARPRQRPYYTDSVHQDHVHLGFDI